MLTVLQITDIDHTLDSAISKARLMSLGGGENFQAGGIIF